MSNLNQGPYYFHLKWIKCNILPRKISWSPILEKNADLFHSLHSECRLFLCSKAESYMRNDKTGPIEGCPGSLPDREFQVNGKHTELKNRSLLLI